MHQVEKKGKQSDMQWVPHNEINQGCNRRPMKKKQSAPYNKLNQIGMVQSALHKKLNLGCNLRCIIKST
jgi:hypothetical protein